jgi:hypothetical protein
MNLINLAPDKLVDEKKVAAAAEAEKKKKKKVEEVVEEPPDPMVVLASYLEKGNRIITEMPFHFNLAHMNRTAMEIIPAPIYPDPSKNDSFNNYLINLVLKKIFITF